MGAANAVGLADLQRVLVRPRKEEPALWLALHRLSALEQQVRLPAERTLQTQQALVPVRTQQVPEAARGAERTLGD